MLHVTTRCCCMVHWCCIPTNSKACYLQNQKSSQQICWMWLLIKNVVFQKLYSSLKNGIFAFWTQRCKALTLGTPQKPRSSHADHKPEQCSPLPFCTINFEAFQKWGGGGKPTINFSLIIFFKPLSIFCKKCGGSNTYTFIDILIMH